MASSSHAATSLKILSFNVGTAHFSGFSADCPDFKLCHPDAIAEIRKLIQRADPDVILFQETQGPSQLFSTFAAGPVLDAQIYDGSCAAGVSGIQEVCVVWKRSRLILKDPGRGCESLPIHAPDAKPKGGATVLCDLASAQDPSLHVNVVSLHGDTHDNADRVALYQAIWDRLSRSGQPSVLGGDFNTESCTLGMDGCQLPSPETFGTVYGRQVKDYGRWKPTDDFFGNFGLSLVGQILNLVSFSTHYHRRIDHIFANFGQAPLSEFDEATAPDQACLHGQHPWASRVPFDGLFTFFRGGLGWKVDHFPVLACLSLE